MFLRQTGYILFQIRNLLWPSHPLRQGDPVWRSCVLVCQGKPSLALLAVPPNTLAGSWEDLFQIHSPTMLVTTCLSYHAGHAMLVRKAPSLYRDFLLQRLAFPLPLTS